MMGSIKADAPEDEQEFYELSFFATKRRVIDILYKYGLPTVPLKVSAFFTTDGKRWEYKSQDRLFEVIDAKQPTKELQKRYDALFNSLYFIQV